VTLALRRSAEVSRGHDFITKIQIATLLESRDEIDMSILRDFV
jgi:hypothetical protein